VHTSIKKMRDPFAEPRTKKRSLFQKGYHTLFYHMLMLFLEHQGLVERGIYAF